MAILTDTSFLVSLTNPRERQYEACVQIARETRESLIVPVTVLPEAAYLIGERLGHRFMRAFVRQMQQPGWEIEPLQAQDLARSAELLEQYGDSEIDFVDTTIIATAERLNIPTILTLDHRHFRMIRPRHVDYFTLLPQ